MGYIEPAFNGEAIFGFPVTMWTEDPEREKQINAFIGINGVEVLDLGQRVRTTHVKGRVWADTQAGLGAAFLPLRLYKNGRAYTLFTTKGELWFNVQLHRLAEVERIFHDPYQGVFYQNYTATLIHLV
jgi:hypothetical protein